MPLPLTGTTPGRCTGTMQVHYILEQLIRDERHLTEDKKVIGDKSSYALTISVLEKIHFSN